MGESAGNWCLIESDPGVFTELIRDFGKNSLEIAIFLILTCEFHDDFPIFFITIVYLLFYYFSIGVDGLQVEELWTIDADEFKQLE